MQGCRRIVLDMDFEAALSAACGAIREEGLQINARIDVRDHFWRNLRRDMPRYYVIDAWSPDLAWSAIQHDRETGAVFQTTFAVFDCGNDKTVVTVAERFAAAGPAAEPDLASIASREHDRVARIIRRLEGARRADLQLDVESSRAGNNPSNGPGIRC